MELNEQLKDVINEWRKNRAKEEEELQKVKTLIMIRGECGLVRCHFVNILKIDSTHPGPIYPVALPRTQVRFVPDNIDGPKFDARTVVPSVPDSVMNLPPSSPPVWPCVGRLTQWRL